MDLDDYISREQRINQEFYHRKQEEEQEMLSLYWEYFEVGRREARETLVAHLTEQKKRKILYLCYN